MSSNIVLIVIDALRARNLSSYGYDKLTTPNIDSLAEVGAIFQNCFSCTNATDPSFTTIFSGRYPATHGIIEHGETSASIYTKKLEGILFLQSVLTGQGYLSIGIDWLGRWHKWGFDYYSGLIKRRGGILDSSLFTAIKDNSWISTGLEFLRGKIKFGVFSQFYLAYDRAKAVTDRALNTLERYKGRDFFLFIHYWDTHIPYDSPQAHLRQFEKETYNPEADRIEDIWRDLKDWDWKHFLQRYTKGMKLTREVLARYDAAIHYVDGEIGRLMQGLKGMGLLEDTLVIVTADHGESLTEHGIYFDHHGLYDDLIHVPLIIYYPKAISPRRIKTVVQHVDLVPTILDLVDIGCSSDNFDGQSLVPLLKGEEKPDFHPFIYVEEAKTQRKFAIRTEKFKYIFAPSEAKATCSYCGRIHGGVEELYELEQDPAEEHNIVSKSPEIRDELRGRLLEFREGLQKKRGKHRLGERIKNLRALGKI